MIPDDSAEDILQALHRIAANRDPASTFGPSHLFIFDRRTAEALGIDWDKAEKVQFEDDGDEDTEEP